MKLLDLKNMLNSKQYQSLVGKGLDELRPPQELAIKAGLFENKNMVVASPTSSGKTLVAEMAAIYNILKSGSKTLYIVPLKALASEKFNEFKELYGHYVDIALSIGDYDSNDQWLHKYDLIITTSEKFDSLLRHKVPWIREIGTIVIDEIHMLDDGHRGPTLEVLITRLKTFCSQAQLIALSATISNSDELAEWLDAELVKSNYRPVELREAVYINEELDFDGHAEKLQGASKVPEVRILEDTLAKQKSMLLFLSSRRNAEGAAKKCLATVKKKLTPKENMELQKLSGEVLHALESPTKQCRILADCVSHGVAFHHAGLVSKQRAIIEKAFRERLIKVISATPTLAMGINLPAFRAVVRDLKRYSSDEGMGWIPTLEFKQMVGRCITGDTILFSEEGSITMKELEKTGEDNKILSIDPKTLQTKYVKIKKIWKRKTNSIIEIETRSGKIIRVTPEHPLLCFTKSKCGKPRILNEEDNEELYNKVIELRKKHGWGPHRIAKYLKLKNKTNTIQHWFYENNKPKKKMLEWIIAKDLKKINSCYKDDYFASVKGFKTGKLIDPHKFLSIDKIVNKGDNRFMNKQGHQTCSFPDKWSNSLCRFIAKIMADGSIYYNEEENSYQIRYFNKNKEVHTKYNSMCKELFDKKPSLIFRKGSYQSSFKSFVVGNFLNNIGVSHGKKSLILRLPRILFSLSNNLVKEFIKEYCFCDGWDGKSEYNLVTCSEGLAHDFSLLFSKLGMVSRIHKKKPNDWRKRYMWNISVSKQQFDKNKHTMSVGSIFPDQIKSIKKIRKSCQVYDITLENTHNFIANGIIVHNSGRPGLEDHGEGIAVAKTVEEADELFERYIKGDPEDIYSKLSVEPVLRMQILGLIATGEIKSFSSLMEFFSKTFYAFQYEDLSRIEVKLQKILNQLVGWGFIKPEGQKLVPTMLGKRVAELYIDPYSASLIIESLKKSNRSDIYYLHMICSCLEMHPLLRMNAKEFTTLQQQSLEFEEDLPEEPSPWDMDYETWIKAFKTSLMFHNWINEITEAEILEKYRETPGMLHTRLNNADWLLYSATEIATLLALKNELAPLRKLRIRVKNGVREELLRLLKFEGIGRVRARKLYSVGIKGAPDVKKASLETLSKIIGKKTAKKLKDQVVSTTGQKTLA